MSGNADKAATTPRSELDATLRVKALRDPYYRVLANVGASADQLLRAGFFDDKLASSVRDHVRWDPTMPTTPVRKLQSNRMLSGRSLVLLATGAFSPVHRGHLAMMEGARRACEAAGYWVVAGYLSPGHDDYVNLKQQGAAALHHEHRIALLEEAVSSSHWLDVCPWEARYAPTALNFTDVLDRLKEYLAHQTGKPVDVAYVFGSDNAGFLDAFHGAGLAVCVQRVGVPRDFVQKRASRANWLYGTADDYGSSSSEVRAGASHLVPDAAKARYAALNPPSAPSPCERPLYLIREDIEHALKDWEGIAPDSGTWFESRLVQLFRDTFHTEGMPVEVRGLSLQHQREMLAKLSGTHAILSLDVCAPAEFNLGFSRVFAVSGGQVFSKLLGSRLGKPSVSKQIAQQPMQPVWLVDDDRSSGLTEYTVSRWLRESGRPVAGATYLNHLSLQDAGLDHREVRDIVDARDFLLGGADSGLVVQLADGELARAPYVFPFVNLVFRAKLPPAQVSTFCTRLWLLNVEWFEAHGPQLTVADANPGTRTLLKSMGFVDSTLLLEVALRMFAWASTGAGEGA